MTSTTRISLAEGTELIRDTLTAAGATIEASTSVADALIAAGGAYAALHQARSSL